MQDNHSNEEQIQYGLREEDYYQVAAANIEKRKAARELKQKKAPRKPAFAIVVMVAIIAMFILSFTNIFVVDNIEVEGNHYFSDEEVITMAHAAPGRNLIYHPNKKSIKDYLKQNTYIEDVKVSRKLPSTLVIKVKERKQVCAIVYDDDYLIIDGNGVLLRKTMTEPKLTIASGMKIKHIALGEEIKTDSDRVFGDLLHILNSMDDKDLFFSRIEMSDLYIKAYIYDGLVCKGTYEQFDSAIKTDRLHKILQKLLDDGIKRGTITFSDDGYASYKPVID